MSSFQIPLYQYIHAKCFFRQCIVMFVNRRVNNQVFQRWLQLKKYCWQQTTPIFFSFLALTVLSIFEGLRMRVFKLFLFVLSYFYLVYCFDLRNLFFVGRFFILFVYVRPFYTFFFCHLINFLTPPAKTQFQNSKLLLFLINVILTGQITEHVKL